MSDSDQRLFFLGTSFDEPYLPRLKSCVGVAQVSYSLAPILTWAEVKKHCEAKGVKKIFTTSVKLLSILLHHPNKDPSLKNYAGSLFERDGFEILFVPPLEHLITVTYGKFLLSHYITKLTRPQDWPEIGEFSFQVAKPETFQDTLDRMQRAILVAVDIETKKDPLRITCIGYTAVYEDLSSETYVIPCDSMFNLTWIRRFNWELKAPKVLQNGKYDHSYLAAWNAPCYNYAFDTATFFHAWFSELPKDLAFLNGFCVRKAMYWKDLAETRDLYEYYRYNGLDTHATAGALVYMLLKSPQWAKENFLQEFPLLFPSHMCEMRGIKRDMSRLKEAEKEELAKIEESSKRLEVMTATPRFNTNSSRQVAALFKILGRGDITSTVEKNMNKVAFSHPLNKRIINHILDVRGWRKLASTYLVAGKEYNGRILYAINPHGTDTGRCASREHHFWCGLQIQNIPATGPTKSTLIADEGFKFAEVDLEQAESRDTAYISGDKNLQNAVECGRDFHSTNTEAFFGVPYESIYDDSKGKTKNKPLRDLAKRVNHGANYNMGEATLIDTMGEEKAYEAKRLLQLPKLFTLKQVAAHLLAAFHKAYPNIRAVFHRGVVTEVLKTGMLSSQAQHDCKYQASTQGWARRCFGDPQNNKLDLNAYVAHVPQSLNAMTLNKAFMAVFYEIALHPVHSKNFKLLAQIHDSILIQFRIGHEYLAEQVKQLMQIPVTIKGYDGVTRTFVVPAAVKAGKDGKGADRWSETE